MTNREYGEYISKISPRSKSPRNMFRAFVSGGLICCVGQCAAWLYEYLGLGEQLRPAAVSITMVFLGVLLTGLGVYDRLAKFAGAGTLVPITGFANAVSAPAIEFHSEGVTGGTCVKMFSIAGPVIVYGVSASVLYGLLLCILT